MPPKGTFYRDFEDNPELEFEFSLAEALGMLVSDLRARIGNDEFVRWKVYYGRRAQDRQLAEQRRR